MDLTDGADTVEPGAGREPLALPAAGVRFEADFLPRVERCVARLASAVQRAEGAGSARARGTGEEFEGHRPYRPGEDLRQLDWNLLGRLDRPFVRVTRREAREHWRVLVDTSGSMGVGPPGKLQRAAEVAVALACLGARAGARVVLDATGLGELAAGGHDSFGRWMAAFEQLEAGGAEGLAGPLARAARARWGRAFLLGDLVDLEPGALAPLGRPGRELQVAQLLAPVELEPRSEFGASESWFHVRDPESPAGRWVRCDEAALASYERSLEQRLDTWRSAAGRHRFGYGCYSTARPFEDILRGLSGA